MDRIAVKGLKVETIIGVNDWERKLPRVLLIDLELAVDAARAAQADRIDATVNYHAVAQAAAAFVRDSRVALIETLAEQLAQRLIRDFNVRWIAVTVHKPGAVPGADNVRVTIERGQRG